MEKLAIVIDIETLRSIRQLKQELYAAHEMGNTVAAQDIAQRLVSLYSTINFNNNLEQVG